ncbi:MULTISPECIES: dephospho-CoA kinase [Pedobacter]|uniref:Dephospho-CoA kinase n=1 Tax=Pedobacter heparinus (strain ATCC 13125 / DSM 2366 / CIP 104194 / JCM 7457 / NBRC 12017 / NCIMB 9290 / NRRL B-14731 / HIM 762-3) TaxID=485917 RepID=C6XT58_PEDHD|nr:MULTISPECIES: dephospho-CoA kinase [Pedobacter]ACU03619.1 dephospho-CoA kinase [Pedobacter heparinus DSM 2366]MBB5436869.1 dephospho-CoA kinase [Pedobacter sp. AK017]
MLKIGITGGIGSGKTTICKVFETMGIPVFYADTVAKQLMVTDELLMSGVRHTFGTESYAADGTLNNKHIAAIVFNNADELARLNALVHPAVFRAFEVWVKQVPAHVPYVLKEAALLFESGSYKMCDQNILVLAPEAARLQWVMERDGVSAAQVKARMDKQLPDEEKMKLADHLIYNNETASLIIQVLRLHQLFLNKPE